MYTGRDSLCFSQLYINVNAAEKRMHHTLAMLHLMSLEVLNISSKAVSASIMHSASKTNVLKI
jgi:hypothetical protein